MERAIAGAALIFGLLWLAVSFGSSDEVTEDAEASAPLVRPPANARGALPSIDLPEPEPERAAVPPEVFEEEPPAPPAPSPEPPVVERIPWAPQEPVVADAEPVAPPIAEPTPEPAPAEEPAAEEPAPAEEPFAEEPAAEEPAPAEEAPAEEAPAEEPAAEPSEEDAAPAEEPSEERSGGLLGLFG